ncbi:regulatory particle non-ATPase [Taxawa tesnikishii (nom. ined.)]|nr:regulatory particle non-ATPase [Dothideales sp. JES 119]
MSKEETLTQDRIVALRQELKAWEKSFSAANAGRKPGRDDIKQNAAIAAKYKEYDRLRRPQPQKRQAQASTPRKRAASPPTPQAAKLAAPIHATPRKNTSPSAYNHDNRLPHEPEEEKQEEEEEEEEDSEPEPTPPQSVNSSVLRLKKTARSSQAPEYHRAVRGRGRRTGTAEPDARIERETLHAGRLRHASEAEIGRYGRGCGEDTPVKEFATPAFLRRSTSLARLEALTEEAEEAGIGLGMRRMREPPFKKRGLVRSLSSIIKGLREQEEQRMDDEMDMLREMEMGAQKTTEVGEVQEPEVQVEDSQAADMPLGPDRNAESEEEAEEEGQGLDAEGRPRKVWKKKGLKRQTRRVIMRPVLHKPKKQQVREPLSDGDADPVSETQLQAHAQNPSEEGKENDPEEQASGDSEYDEGTNAVPVKAKKPTKSTKQEKKKEGAAKKAPRKISATAHANFVKLKIKNKNSKGKGRGRFGRR